MMSRTLTVANPCRPQWLPLGTLCQTLIDKFSSARHAFLGCLLFIVGVSIYDSYLVALYRDAILFDERNPICEILIRKDPNHLSWFMLGKFLGNLGVVGTLMLLRWIGYKQTLTVAVGVAFFQLALLTFLTFSDPMTGLLHFDDLYSQDPVRAAKAVNSALLHGVVMTVTIVAGLIVSVKWKNIRNTPRSEPATA